MTPCNGDLNSCEVLARNSSFSLSDFSSCTESSSIFLKTGTLLYGRLKKPAYKQALLVCGGIALAGGILLLTVGKIGPVFFMLSYIPFAVMSTYIRLYTAEMLLNAQKENIGAASAMMNFGFTMLGSLGMFIGSLRWTSYVSGIAYTIFMFTVCALAIFTAAGRLRGFQPVSSGSAQQ